LNVQRTLGAFFKELQPCRPPLAYRLREAVMGMVRILNFSSDFCCSLQVMTTRLLERDKTKTTEKNTERTGGKPGTVTRLEQKTEPILS